ncbi:MAG: CpaF family protein [Pseudomonadota bacterium]
MTEPAAPAGLDAAAPPPVRAAAPAPEAAQPKPPAPKPPAPKPAAAKAAAPKPAAEPEKRATTTARSADFYRFKQDVFETLMDAMDMTRIAALDRDAAEQEISAIITDIIAIKSFVMSTAEQAAMVEEICDDVLGYGPLESLLERDDIADIMVNGARDVFIETGGRVEKTGIQFRDNQQLLEICQRMVSKVGRRVDEASPICDARLLDGSRVNVIAPPLSIDGPSLTIRKFKKDKLKLEDLVRFQSISPDAAEVMKIAAFSRCNILISGGTGSGKTTLLNCLSGFAGDEERIVTCEDSAELQLQQPHVVRLETRPPNIEGKGEITMRALVKNCLRMRPERIIVGEVRGPEAFDLLQAMNTGHDGSMGTLHANSPREALSRLESMITMGGFTLPSKTIREMICSAVNVIVQAQRLRDGSRRITHITEVLGMEGETIITQDLVRYEIEGEDANGKLIGRHRGCGVGQPNFWERARTYNKHEDLVGALARMDEEEDGPSVPPAARPGAEGGLAGRRRAMNL